LTRGSEGEEEESDQNEMEYRCQIIGGEAGKVQPLWLDSRVTEDVQKGVKYKFPEVREKNILGRGLEERRGGE